MNDSLNFSIVKDDCSNLTKLIELAQTYYSDGDIVNEKYINWQYRTNPAGLPFLFISNENTTNELAGQYLVIPLEYNLNGMKVLGTLSLNTLTKPKFQGKGLFTKMALATYDDCAKHGANFTVGFPNPQSYPGFVRKLNFIHIGDVPLLIKPLNYCSLIISYISGKKKKHGGEIPMTNNKQYLRNIRLLDLTNPEDLGKIDIYWEKIKASYKISSNKNSSFLKWRYQNIPTRNYSVFGYEDELGLQAIVILRLEYTWGFKVGFIIDFTYNRQHPRSGKQMLKFAKRFFKVNKLEFIATLNTKGNSDYNLLKKNGYIKIPKKILPQQIPFIVRINKEFPNSELLLDLKNWKLSFGDYDIF